MRFASYASLTGLALALAIGCSAGKAGFNNTTTGTGANGNGGDGGSIFTNTGGSGQGGANGCSAEAKLIYVLSDANELYSFDPPAKVFSHIGTLGCNTAMAPNSMAVDRDANAWVNYVGSDPIFLTDNAGAIFKVSTANASCAPSASVNLTDGWYRMGMGFSTNGAQSTDETLFVAGIGSAGSGTGLGSVQGSSVVPIHAFGGQLAGQNAELTGTGDGRLFGFFTTSPVQVAEIDKTNGGILSTHALPTVEQPAAWAFSFWGGDFYLYTAPDPTLNPGRTTNVTRYRPSDQSVDTAYMTNIGFRIVGAGVSTCAPLTPPS